MTNKQVLSEPPPAHFYINQIEFDYSESVRMELIKDEEDRRAKGLDKISIRRAAWADVISPKDLQLDFGNTSKVLITKHKKFKWVRSCCDHLHKTPSVFMVPPIILFGLNKLWWWAAILFIIWVILDKIEDETGRSISE